MVEANVMVTEAEMSISLCAVLINLVELDIPLTAFVQTQAITATGSFDMSKFAIPYNNIIIVLRHLPHCCI